MSPRKLLSFFCTVLVLGFGLVDLAEAQDIAPVSSTPSLTSTPAPPSVPVGIYKIEVQLQDGRLDETSTKTGIVEIITTLFQSGWLLIALFIILLFHSQLRKILDGFSSQIGKSQFEFGQLKVVPMDVIDIVREREILKTMVTVSMIDNIPSPSELKVISEISEDLDRRLDVLRPEDKVSILEAGIRVALADGSFGDSEYGSLKTTAIGYKIAVSELEKMIRTYCKEEGIAIPDVMQG